MTESWVLALWVVTAAGGMVVLALAVWPRRGRVPAHLGIPGPLIAGHVALAVGGLAAWTALVISADGDAGPPWILPALAAVAAAVLGAAMFWRGHVKQPTGNETATRPDATNPVSEREDPAADRPPNALRYLHGTLGVATAVAALVVAMG
jgi:manganese efflux pump family protein